MRRLLYFSSHVLVLLPWKTFSMFSIAVEFVTYLDPEMGISDTGIPYRVCDVQAINPLSETKNGAASSLEG